MIKNRFKQDIEDIRSMSENMPSLYESVNFYEDEEEPAPVEGPVEADGNPETCPDGDCAPAQEDEMTAGEIAQIRKVCLSGMSRLSDTPEDEIYIKLKKIFQMVDKQNNPEKGKMNESVTHVAIDRRTGSVISSYDFRNARNGNIIRESIARDLVSKGISPRYAFIARNRK